MDLFSQYKQDHPEEFREKQKPRTSPDANQYGFLIRMTMKLSGGTIQDVNQASYVLLVAVIILAALAVFFYTKLS